MDRSTSHYPPPTGFNHPSVKNVHLILSVSWTLVSGSSFLFCHFLLAFRGFQFSVFCLHEGIRTLRWSCCRLCSDWSRWSPSAPSPRGASSCCPSAPSLLCTAQPRAGNYLSSHSGFWSQISLPTAPRSGRHEPPGPGLQPPGSRAELLSSSASIPPLLLRALKFRRGPGKRLFSSCPKMSGRRISLSRSPYTSASISQADAVQRVSERPQRMHSAQGGVTEVKEEFRKFQQESPKPPPPATVFTFISWSEGIFQVRKEEKKKKNKPRYKTLQEKKKQ